MQKKWTTAGGIGVISLIAVAFIATGAINPSLIFGNLYDANNNLSDTLDEET